MPELIYVKTKNIHAIASSCRHSFLTVFFSLLSFVGRVHRCGQVPHLDAAIALSREQIAARSRSHSTGTLTLSYHEASDGSAIH